MHGKKSSFKVKILLFILEDHGDVKKIINLIKKNLGECALLLTLESTKFLLLVDILSTHYFFVPLPVNSALMN